MKYSFIILLAVFCGYNLTAQKIDSASVAKLPAEKREEVNGYLREARDAKTTALVLSIGGGALAIGGVAFIVASLDNWTLNWNGTGPGENDPKDEIGAALFLVGAASGLASIPFFIKIHKKRNAARAIIFADRGVGLAPGTVLPGTRSQGISIVIPIGK